MLVNEAVASHQCFQCCYRYSSPFTFTFDKLLQPHSYFFPIAWYPPSDHIVPHHTTDKSELFFGEGGLILWLFDYRKQTQPLAHSTLKGS